jgi:hypothetical protein
MSVYRFWYWQLVLLPRFFEFFIRILGVVYGVQLGQLGTSATIWPIVSAPGDYKDGEFGGKTIGRENLSIRRKTAPVPLCPP